MTARPRARPRSTRARTGLNRVAFDAARAARRSSPPARRTRPSLRALADLGLDEAELERARRCGSCSSGCRARSTASTSASSPRGARGGCSSSRTSSRSSRRTLQRRALPARPTRRSSLGKRDADGRPLLSAARRARRRRRRRAPLAPRRSARSAPGAARRRAPRSSSARRARAGRSAARRRRTPFFCSGCPHNRSTQADRRQLVGAGIGCHAMVALDAGGGRGRSAGITADGRRGRAVDRHGAVHRRPRTSSRTSATARSTTPARWRSAPPSRPASTITYKLLYNDAVAMTGGQRAEGRLDVPALDALARARGRHAGRRHDRRNRSATAACTLDPIATVRAPRRPARRSQRELRRGRRRDRARSTTDRCATEERRLRKRGKLPAPAERVVDQRAGLRGLRRLRRRSRPACRCVPVETEFGRKTQIHQASCNTGLLLPGGRLPVVPDVVAPATRAARRRAPRTLPVDAARAARRARRRATTCCVRMPGIGGTGVVTVSQILADGRARSTACTPRASTRRAWRRRAARSSATCGSPTRPGRAARCKASRGSGRRAARRSTCSARPPPRTSRPPTPSRTVAVVNTAHVADRGDGHRHRRARSRRRTTRCAAIDAATRRATSVCVDAQALCRARCSATTCRRTCCCSARPTSTAACRSAPQAIERGDPPQRRGGRDEPRGVRAGAARRRRTRTRSTAALAAGARGAASRRREAGRDRRRAPAATGALRRGCSSSASPTSTGYQSGAYARTLRRRGREVARGRARARRRRRAGRRGLRPRPAQADGLQGRVRGRPPAPRPGRAGARRAPSSGRARRCRCCCTRRCCGRSG